MSERMLYRDMRNHRARYPQKASNCKDQRAKPCARAPRRESLALRPKRALAFETLHMPFQITNATIASAKSKARPGAAQEEILDSRAEGLRLRIGARGVRWQIRMRHAGASIRLDLGDVDEWGIAEARAVAIDAKRLSRSGTLPDDVWVDRQRVTAGKKDAPAPIVQPGLWTWEDGKREYLAEVERTKRPATLRDYRNMLGTPELARFDGKAVAGVGLEDLATVVEDVHRRGVERHAEHLASVLRPMWTFLGSPTKRALSGVKPGVMRELTAPQRSRQADGSAKRKAKYVPSMLEIGRIVAIARSGAVHPIAGAAVEMAVFTAQRRMQIVLALRDRFEPISDTEGLWSVPSAHRKTAERRGDESDHVVPLPPAAWSAADRAVKWCYAQDDDRLASSRRVYPQLRPRKSTDVLDDLSHMSADTLSHTLSYFPGCKATPHDLRRAFGTHVEHDLGFKRSDTKTILDHLEGEASGDVTGASYALHDGSHFKWPIARAWADHIEKHVALAVEADPRLADAQWLTRQIQIAQDIAKNMRPRYPTVRAGGLKALPS